MALNKDTWNFSTVREFFLISNKDQVIALEVATISHVFKVKRCLAVAQ